MPKGVMRKWQDNIVASRTETATGNSGLIRFPSDVDSVALVLDVTAASGTSPTMDVAIQCVPDGDITTPVVFYTVARYAQNTGTVTLLKTFLSHQGEGTAAAVLTVADTGGVLESNVAFTNDIRILWTIGGTNPSFTFRLWGWGERKEMHY